MSTIVPMTGHVRMIQPAAPLFREHIGVRLIKKPSCFRTTRGRSPALSVYERFVGPPISGVEKHRRKRCDCDEMAPNGCRSGPCCSFAGFGFVPLPMTSVVRRFIDDTPCSVGMPAGCFRLYTVRLMSGDFVILSVSGIPHSTTSVSGFPGA